MSILSKSISRFKLLLLGKTAENIAKILYNSHEFANTYVEAAEYRMMDDQQCCRILYELKRKYYFRIIWTRCNNYANALRYAIFKSSRHWSGGVSSTVVSHKDVRINYMLSGLPLVKKEAILSLMKDDHRIFCCKVCKTNNIKSAELFDIINQGEGFCCDYCNKSTQCYLLIINKEIGMNIFG